MASETLYDGPTLVAAMVADMRQIDRAIPVPAKLEPIRNELAAIKKDRWSDMLLQTRKAVESAIASLDAALLAERQHARRHLVDHAAKGQLAPRRVLKAVEPAPDAHEITDRMIGGTQC